jgi:hypothetical protein
MESASQDFLHEIRDIALAEIEKYWLPHPTHFEISEKKAIALAEKFDAELMVVQLWVRLMDLKLWQAFAENRLYDHVAMSSIAAQAILNKYPLSNTQMAKIINCIESHHWDVPFSCVEAEICTNADCYRFIHPEWFFLWLTVLWKRWLPYHECLEKAHHKLNEKYQLLSLDICHQELDVYYQTFSQYLNDAWF